ncbi:MAG: TIGR01666 family membrane protein [Curvibacter sp.]|nr:TIGR01666 family membrane protein [Curvibacter sp.]
MANPWWRIEWQAGWQQKMLLRGLRPLVALACVVGLGWWLDADAAVMPLVLGVNASALAETDDSWRGRLRAQLATLLAFALMAVAIQASLGLPWMFLGVLLVAVLVLTLLGAVGERYRAITSATLIMGLYVALASRSQSASSLQNLLAPGLLLAGAAWYGVVSVLWAALFPRRQVQQNLAELYEALGEYLRLKARLFEPVRGVDLERRRLALALQNGRVVQALNTCKESLLSRLPPGGPAPRLDAQAAPWLRHAFRQYLVAQDLHERASSSHEHYELLSEVFFHSDVLYRCQRVLALVGLDCQELARGLPAGHLWSREGSTARALEDLEAAIRRVEAQPWPAVEALALAEGSADSPGGGAARPLRSLRALATNLGRMDQVLARASTEGPLPQEWVDTSLLDRGPRDFRDGWARVRNELHLRSPLLRHGLRLCVALAAGFTLARATGDRHGLWILLTIVFVCRPQYGDTLRRLGERVWGTVLGLVVGWALLRLFPQEGVQSVAMVVAGVLFVATRQTRYTLATAAITALVLLSFNQIGNGFGLILPRLLDTVAGSVIAALAVWLVWPDWQSRRLPRLAAQVLRSQANYLQEIVAQYRGGKQDHLGYRLARRNAHNADAAFSAAMSALFGEPGRVRRNAAAGMRFLVLSHTLLNYLSALGAHRHEGLEWSGESRFAADAEGLVQALLGLAGALQTGQPVPVAAALNDSAAGAGSDAANADLVRLLQAQLTLALRLLPALRAVAAEL